MSGSGNLEVMRLVKKLRVRVTTPEVTYGSHMAIHMSLGLLFLGGICMVFIGYLNCKATIYVHACSRLENA